MYFIFHIKSKNIKEKFFFQMIIKILCYIYQSPQIKPQKIDVIFLNKKKAKTLTKGHFLFEAPDNLHDFKYNYLRPKFRNSFNAFFLMHLKEGDIFSNFNLIRCHELHKALKWDLNFDHLSVHFGILR